MVVVARKLLDFEVEELSELVVESLKLTDSLIPTVAEFDMDAPAPAETVVESLNETVVEDAIEWVLDTLQPVVPATVKVPPAVKGPGPQLK